MSTTDRQIRIALRNRLRRQYEGDTHRLLDEFWIPVSHERADIVLLNGELVAFEIKSGRDDLDRLPRQAVAFGRVFDRVTAVVDSRHLGLIQTSVPPWWGMIEVVRRSGRLELRAARAAKRNPSVDLEVQVRLLWRDELVLALRRLNCVEAAEASRDELRRQLLMQSSPPRLRRIVRETLLARDLRERRF